MGIDVAGEVVAVGERVDKFAVGDAIYGRTRTGAFAEYCSILAFTAVSKPSNITYEEAATLGIGVSTAALALFHPKVGLGVDPPSAKQTYADPNYVLIWGGSSSVGLFTIQLGTLIR